jgi:V-type H+-transporting ATPase subunit d
MDQNTRQLMEVTQTTPLNDGHFDQYSYQKLLSMEADRHAIRITLNSFGTELSKADRRNLYTNFGTMYPDGFARLANCETVDEVKRILVAYPEFRELTKSDDPHYIDRVRSLFFCITRLNDLQGLRVLELEACGQALDEQFNFAIFYAFVKFQENEINNLMWLTECVAQRQKSSLGEGIVYIQ